MFRIFEHIKDRIGPSRLESRLSKPPVLETLESRVLLSADGLLDVALPDPLEHAWQVAEQADVREANGQMEERLAATEGEVCEPIVTLSVDSDHAMLSVDSDGTTDTAAAVTETAGIVVAEPAVESPTLQLENERMPTGMDDGGWGLGYATPTGIRGPPVGTKELVFVDAVLVDSSRLIDIVDPDVELILLDAGRDGARQVAESLAGRTGISAIHIVSHGAPGQVGIGRSLLDSTSIETYADTLRSWGEALTQDGDILFYGCSVGAGPAGVAFLQEVAALTGADVAASTDPTGAAEFGGDWILERATGPIEATGLLPEGVPSAVRGLLAIGLVASNNTDSVTVFDTNTDTVLGNVRFNPGTIGDVAITADGSLGFVTNFASRIWVIDLTTTPPTLPWLRNPIQIPNYGEDLSITADQKYLLVSDGGARQPLVVIDIASRTVVDTLSVSPDTNSVEACSDGSVLSTSTILNQVCRLMIGDAGTLVDTGERLGASAPNNVFGAPGGTSGLVVTRNYDYQVRSFLIPGLTTVETRTLTGSAGISGLVSPAGDRAYFLSETGDPRFGGTGAVDAFAYDAATGRLGAAPLYTIPVAAAPPAYGMDQMALTADGTKLYVSQPSSLNVYDALSGAFITSITHPNIAGATGVAIAQGPALGAKPRITEHAPSGRTIGPLTSTRVEFSEAMDQGSFSLADDVGSFTGPLGDIIPTGFEWVDADTLEITFDPQWAWGAYAMVLGPQILDLDGNPLDQDGDSVAGEVPDDQYVASFELASGPYVTGHSPSGDQAEPVHEVTVTFNEAIDPNTFTAADVVIEGPSGSVPLSGAPVPVGDNTYLLSFAQQSAYGTYHVYVGPQVENTLGAPMDQDRDGIMGELLDDRYDASFAVLDARGARISGHSPDVPMQGPLNYVDLIFDEAIDANSFDPSDVSMTGPGGTISPEAVQQLEPTVFRVSFPEQSGEGIYVLTVGPQISDLAGNVLDQDQDGLKGEVDDRYAAVVEIDRTGPRVAGHSVAGVQNIAVRSFDMTFDEGIDAATFTPDLVTVTGPSGSYSASGVTALDSKSLRITVPAREADGTYLVVVAATITDLAGNKLDQDSDGQGGEPLDDRYQFEFIQQLPNLTVTGIVYPAECRAGQQVDLQWTVTNIGQGIATGAWADTVYLSEDDHVGSDVQMIQAPFDQPLAVGASYTRVLTVTIPPDAGGSRWFIVRADDAGQLDEHGASSDNTTVGTPPTWVTTRPYPDLQVTEVVVPGSISAGENATVAWTVRNLGTGPTSAAFWYDAIYLSSDTVLNSFDEKLLEIRNLDFLAAGESYTRVIDVPIPAGTSPSTFFLIAKVDANDNEEEFDLEGNNVTPSTTSAEVVIPAPPFLSVTDIQVPEAIQAGSQASFTWTVTNTGGATIRTGGWYDDLALSRDEIYDEAEDYGFGSPAHFDGLPLGPGASYTLTGTTGRPVPAWAPGVYYLIVLPDTDRDVVPGYGVAAVNLEYADPPDLRPVALSGPAGGVAGQAISLSFTVQNQGLGTTRFQGWNDTIYFSLDAALDSGDIGIGSRNHGGDLPVGASYDVADVGLVVPTDIAEGDYYLLVETDSGAEVYEADEYNNVLASETTVAITRVDSDVQVVSAVTPAEGVAGESITVDWTVANNGPETTAVGNWTDAVFLSQDATLDTLQDHLLGMVDHAGILAAGETYSAFATVSLPAQLEGVFHLFVVTDETDGLYEPGAEDNNAFHVAQTLAIADLAPDLAVRSVAAPSEAVAGQTIDVGWLVTNSGTAAAVPTWWDLFYLSSDDALDRNTDRLLAALEHATPLNVGEDYGPAPDVTQLTLPDEMEGTYYLLLLVDARGTIYEKGSEDNNVFVQAINITDRAPDLRVQAAAAPAGGVAGQLIEVDFSVINEGEEAASTYFKDALFLSRDDQFDPAGDSLFAWFDRLEPVGIGASYGPADAPAHVRLPDRIEGEFRIFMVTDVENVLYEKDGENNNVYLLPQPIEIILTSADLQVSVVESPASATAGTVINIGWTAVNGGVESTDEAYWQDGVYLSADAIFNPAGDVELGIVGHTGRVAAGGAYSSLAPFELRQDLEGAYYVYVMTDVRHQVFEHDQEGNNILAAGAVLTVTGVHADLQVTALDVPALAVAGENVTVAWTVANAGPDTTSGSSWFDAVFLSADGVLDSSDTSLGTFSHNGRLTAGGSYTVLRSFTTPAGTAGQFFVLVQTDSGTRNDLYEYQAENNNLAAAPIELVLNPPVDLQVISVVAPATAWSAQSVQVEWTVANLGGTTAVPRYDMWYDSVYLSRDLFLDPDFDLHLGAVAHEGPLTADGGAYTQSVDGRLPPGISGPYYVLVRTDTTDHVFERGLEGNNASAAPSILQVNLTPPCDLQVTQITVPVSGVYGEPVLWSYEVANLGTLDAVGAWYDTLYLSSDQQWSLDDARIGRVYHQGDVLQGASYTESLTANVPALVPSVYYVIVRTDILDDVRELDETNNALASADIFAVEGRELTLGNTLAGTLAAGQSTYYQIQVDSGVDLAVILGGAAGANADVFVAYEAIPTRSGFDARSTSIAGVPQSARVAGTQAGSYYVLVYGDYTGGAEAYEITAAQLDMAITGVTPNSGGNVGTITVAITGTQLPLEPTARLVSGDEVITASRIYPGDPAGFYATFDLRGRPVGVYDLQVEQPDGVYTTAQAVFTIEAGVGADLQADLIVPALVRVRAPFTMMIEYLNAGDIDMPSPLLHVTGPADVTYGLAPGQVDSVGEIMVLGYSATGPAGILRPGARQRIELYCTASNSLTAHYELTSQTADPVNPSRELIDWDALESDYRPPFASDEYWNPLWRLFTREAGATWDEVIVALGQWVTDTPHDSPPNILVEDLMQDLFRRAMDSGGGLTDFDPPWIMTHIPVPASTGGIDYVDLIFSESIDLATFTPDDVVMTDPLGQPVAPISIGPVSGRLVQIDFPTQTVAGLYHVWVGPDIEDTAGNPISKIPDPAMGNEGDGRYDASFIVAGEGALGDDAEVPPLYIRSNIPSGTVDQDRGVNCFAVRLSRPIFQDTFDRTDVSLTGPNGAIPVFSVDRITSTLYLVRFPLYRQLGTYTLVVGPDIVGLDGRALDQDRDGTPGEAGADTYTGTFKIKDIHGPRVTRRSLPDRVPLPVSEMTIDFNEPIKASTFTVADVIINGPHGPVVPTGISTVSPTSFRIRWDALVEEGTYDFTIGPNITDQSSNPMNQDGDLANGDTEDAYTGAFTVVPTEMIISGYVFYSDYPVHARVQVWEQNGGAQDAVPGATDDVLICEGSTRDDGTFRFDTPRGGGPIRNEDPVDNDWRRDLYIVVLAENAYSKEVDPATVRTVPGNPDQGWTTLKPNAWGRLYSEATVTDENVSGTEYSAYITLSNAAFGVGEVLWTAGDWLENQVHWHRPDKVVVLSPCLKGTFFTEEKRVNGVTIRDFINIGEETENAATLTHEYGHAIHYALRGDHMPLKNGIPTGPEEDPAYWTPDRGTGAHMEWSESGTGFAMIEGFAEFFECAVLGNPMEAGLNLVTNNYWMGGEANREEFAPLNVRKDNSTGEIVEGAVATIFWDLFQKDGFSAVWNAFRISNDSVWPAFYSTLGATPAHQAIFIDNGIGVNDDAFEPNDFAGSPANLGQLQGPRTFDGLIMAEKELGAADWFQFTLPATAKAPEDRKEYDLTIQIDFAEHYGDLDLLVEGTGPVKKWDVEPKGSSALVKIDKLWNDQTYEFFICVAGYGVINDKGAITTRGGDYHPNYKLTINGKVPDPAGNEKKEVVKDQSGVVPADPNDKEGPAGYGDPLYIRENTLLPYTVWFENEPDATASAVLVTVTDQLDDDLDWTTFELGEMQFGDHWISVPSGLTYYQTRIDLRPQGNNLLVDIEGRFNVETGLAEWTFTGIDPATGELSSDPLAGFLPPNDLEIHDGEGLVKYIVRPKTALPSGTEITNMATIVFDWNEPIDTPLVGNTIDSEAPNSAIDPLPTVVLGDSFVVSWSGADEAAGAGLANFDIYVSTNGGSYERWLFGVTANSATFVGEPGSSYAFYTRARDYVGHLEAAPDSPDATTEINVPPTVAVDSDTVVVDEAAPAGNTGSFSHTGRDTVTLTASIGAVTQDNGAGTWSWSYTPADGPDDSRTVTITATDSNGAVDTTTFSLTVNNVAPTVAADSAAVVVDEATPAVNTGSFGDVGLDTVTLTASIGAVTQDNGAGTWSWSYTPADGPDDSQTVTITATDSDGDSATTTFALTVNNVPPTVSAISSSEPKLEGTSIGVTGQATDPAAANDTLTYAWEVFKGTGTTAFASQSSVDGTSFSFTPDDNESYRIVLTVSDEDGGGTTVEQTITVANVAPMLVLSGAGTVDEGATYTLGLASSDPGADTISGWTITWGDGAIESVPGNPASVTHVYADGPNACQISATATDEDGTYAAGNTVGVTVNNIVPQVMVDVAEQTVQYSDPIQNITITATDVLADLLVAQAAGLPNGLTFSGEAGNWTIAGSADTAPGIYVITVSVSDGDGGTTNVDIAIDVAPENAVATYVGALLVSTPSIEETAAIIELRAVIQDITAVLPDADPDAGLITNAVVTFVNRDTNLVIAEHVAVQLLDPADPRTGVAIYLWTVDLGSQNSDSITVGYTVEGFYLRAEETAVITVSKPLQGFITGGGYLINQNSAGTYAGDPGLATNFGFSVKFNRTLTDLQGKVNAIVRQDGREYQIKADAMDSLAVDPLTNQATFVSTANLTDITDPANPMSISGGLTLIVTLADQGEPGTADSIGFTLWNDNALWFSSNWTGAQTLEQVLAGGNLVVHAEPSALHAANGSADMQADGQVVTPELLEPVVEEAVSRWATYGCGSKVVSTLEDIEFRIADLSGSTLGLVLGNTVWLDADAAGYGWFLDGTPWDNAEFPITAEDGELLADDFSGASGRMDLLTAVMHELGHVLGLTDLSSAGDAADLMYETLPTGVRRTSTRLVVAREVAYCGVGWHNPRAAQINRFLFNDWLADWLQQISP